MNKDYGQVEYSAHSPAHPPAIGSYYQRSLIAMVMTLASVNAPAIAQNFSSEQALDSLHPQGIMMTSTLPISSTASMALGDRPIADVTHEIDTYLNAYHQIDHFSGNVVVSYGEEPAIIRSYGMANRAHEVANAANTKFRIGSITKQFTAAAVLRLQDEGRLDVQAPISTYLPDYPSAERITVHHLLTHTAGIPEYLDPEAFPDLANWMRLPATLEQLIGRFKDLPLKFEPGERFEYSNSGYVVLTQIIETVSGQPYADYLQTHFFDPLGMADTGYEMPQVVIPHMAQGYLFIGADNYLQTVPIDMSLPQGAGGLYSTVADLAIWNQALLGDHNEPAVLSEAAIASLKSPAVKMGGAEDAPDAAYSYGLVIDSHLDQQRIHHNGGIPGFASILAYYPKENLTISILTNLENKRPEKAAADLAAIVFGQPYDLPEARQAIALDPALYEKYVGTYQLLPDMQITIRVEDEKLMAQATGQDAFTLYPTSETEFFYEVVDATVIFALTDQENVTGLTLYQAGQELFAPKEP